MVCTASLCLLVVCCVLLVELPVSVCGVRGISGISGLISGISALISDISSGLVA